MIKKTIQINPDLFKLNGKSKKKKRKKIKPKLLSSSLKPNQIKKQLIARVKLHQKRKQNDIEKEREKEIKEFQDNFNDSMNFLEQISKKHYKKKQHKKQQDRNKTQKKYIDNTKLKNDIKIQNNITQQSPDSYFKSEERPDPPYSILKNAKNKAKPLFSQYNKTLKKTDSNELNIPKIHIENTDIEQLSNTFVERKNKLDELKAKIKQDNDENKKQSNKKQRKRRQKTRRLIRKITLGKNKTNGTIGVLIKNKKTRKHIKNEHKSLQKKRLNNVKTYLRQHNLIKIGTNAPEIILREIYENSHFAGNIFNKNPDVLLHNYMED
jgi:hypothetical protein